MKDLGGIISMMLTCDASVVVGYDRRRSDQGFLMQQSIGNITTIVGTEI